MDVYECFEEYNFDEFYCLVIMHALRIIPGGELVGTVCVILSPVAMCGARFQSGRGVLGVMRTAPYAYTWECRGS